MPGDFLCPGQGYRILYNSDVYSQRPGGHVVLGVILDQSGGCACSYQPGRAHHTYHDNTGNHSNTLATKSKITIL